MNEQKEAYHDSTEIGSDPLHILDRDNRNHRKKQDIILAHTAAGYGDRVLEVGCGDGTHAQRYAQEFTYHGVDISESLVEETRDKMAGVGPFPHHVTVGNAMELDHINNLFDAVVGTAVLHHLHSPGKALREWIRVTKDGGSITLMEPNPIFPKDLITAYVQAHEKHKRNMFPWRLERILEIVAEDSDIEYKVEHRIYTPPWPARFEAFYDRLDERLRDVPGLRRISQMLLIHVDC